MEDLKQIIDRQKRVYESKKAKDKRLQPVSSKIQRKKAKAFKFSDYIAKRYKIALRIFLDRKEERRARESPYLR